MPERSGQDGHPVGAAQVVPVVVEMNGVPKQHDSSVPAQKRPRKKGPNYGLIHSKPLPLATHPLPAFHPTNPISLLRLVYTYVAHLIWPPYSHPAEKYIGYFSPETRSVHVTDPKHVRALWEMGFFGKGTLSRSEPSWLDREKARVKAKRSGGGGTAEEATNARREDRRLKKMERARAEAEKIERQRLIEEGKLDPAVLEVSDSNGAIETNTEPPTPAPKAQGRTQSRPTNATLPVNDQEPPEDDEEEPQMLNQEHLQLTLEEAFFLTYGLGVLEIHNRSRTKPTTTPHTTTTTTTTTTTSTLLHLFTTHSFFPPRPPTHPTSPDDPFLLSYTVYHHFRSLGWVVRPGIKFSIDYLLYYRGPVFSHAEFAVLIMPSYTHPYWSSSEGREKRRIKEDASKDWWWLHCVNRVQSQVLKSLVLVYVDVPPVVPAREDGSGEMDVGKLLRGYKIREFIVKRWVANRSRD